MQQLTVLGFTGSIGTSTLGQTRFKKNSNLTPSLRKGAMLLLGMLGLVTSTAVIAGSIESDPIDFQTNQAQDSTKKAGRVLGVCEVIANENENYPNSIDLSAVSAASTYLTSYENRTDLTIDYSAAANTTVLSQPKHGALTEDSALNGRYYYLPDTGYVGKDSAEVLVEIKGIKIVVRYFIHVTEYSEPDPISIYCLQGERWKISQDANGNNILTAVNYPSPFTGNTGSSTTDTAASAYTLSASILSTLSVDPSLVTFNLADLAGGAIGQTVGTTITLDPTAAGNNWFIDTTVGTTSHSTWLTNDVSQVAGYPWDNSEYLPTSNPNEWVAKEGSDAYGKMDMLSVLLHEYGHALGIEHSADNHDYMATTPSNSLAPGVRRMPSAEEMALRQAQGRLLMQSLVGQIKGEVTAILSASPSDGTTSHLTRLANNASQVIGYPASGRGWPAGSGEGANVAAPVNGYRDSGSSPFDAFEVALLDANSVLSSVEGTGASLFGSNRQFH